MIHIISKLCEVRTATFPGAGHFSLTSKDWKPDWASVAAEVRPSANKHPDGTLKPFYLKREFKYLDGDRFELSIADEGYEVTPLIQGFADLLNQIAANGYRKWQVNDTQSVFGKAFPPFGLNEGKNFMEFDLVYLSHDMLFWGARNVDGRGFDKEENRPTNLQIPLARK